LTKFANVPLAGKGYLMRCLLERHVASIKERLVLLAPPHRRIPSVFRNVVSSQMCRDDLLGEVQRFRGGIYLSDGAIQQPSLSADGRHEAPEDEHSWHLVRLNPRQEVSACVGYLEHHGAVSIDTLRIRECPLAASDDWRNHLQGAVASEVARASACCKKYVEVGGWAVSVKDRCKAEGVLLAMAAFSLGRLFGGAFGLATATVRHSSASILRRLGGVSLEFNGCPVPAYYDARYGCNMEILRFDSDCSNSKYSGLIDALKLGLRDVLVVAVPDFARQEHGATDVDVTGLPSCLFSRPLRTPPTCPSS
jgi:hypothetical protein